MTAISVVSYNIQHGFGLDGRYDLDRILDAVRDADVIALQEVTRGFMKNGGVDMVAAIQERLPDRFFASHMPADVDFGSTVEDGIAVQRRFQFGNMILSRWPLLATRGHLLPRSVRLDTVNLQRGALETLIDTPVGPIRFYCVHTDHHDPAERLPQIADLKRIASSFAETGGAISGLKDFGFPELPACPDFLLLGDFNFQPETDEYRAMLDGGALVDVSAADGGWSYVDPEDYAIRKRLDYAFANKALAKRVIDVRIDRERQGSDHMPVRLTIEEL